MPAPSPATFSSSPPIPQIAAVLARYPLPNNPTGPYGANTYAASSKVITNANQFSLRLDHQLSAEVSTHGSLQLRQPLRPHHQSRSNRHRSSLRRQYVDHQRNGIVTYTRTVSPRFTFQSSISFTRTTPQFPTPNHTDPAVKFNDGLFEAFNSAGGSVMTAYGNLFQGQQNFTIIAGKHAIKTGGEVRLNRDTTYFGISPNGEYDFGGGTAYSPVDIPSQSGTHNIRAGQALPDTLSALLTGRPFVYTVAVAPPYTSGGYHIGPAAISRNAGGVYAQDTWKVSRPLYLRLRPALGDLFAHHRTRPTHLRLSRSQSTRRPMQEYLDNPQPGYQTDLDSSRRACSSTWRVTDNLHVHAGGAITTIPPNIWQDNFLTGAVPFAIYPHLVTSQVAPINYGFQITSGELPNFYTPSGQNVFASGKTNTVPANTVLDVERYQHDLAALSPGAQLTPLNLTGIDRRFGNGYLQTWTLGLERAFGNLTADAAYVGTASVHLPRTYFPNAYSGAGPGFAPFTLFDTNGNVIGGFGTEQVIEATAHSTYHALQTSLQGPVVANGPSIQASYTWAKSLDDVSAVIGGTGKHRRGDRFRSRRIPSTPTPKKVRPPSTWPTALRSAPLRICRSRKPSSCSPVSRKRHPGWELLSISTISSGSPFTIYSGIQQTGAGSNGVDRPDQIGIPHLSTARKVREDYFGMGANNASYFSIPINQPGGTGPNQGCFGTLGRNTFRGPAYYDFDFSLIKDTPVGKPLQRRRTRRRPVPLRVLQPLQHRQHGPARQHHPRLRLRPNQPNRRHLPPDPVLAEDTLLRSSPLGIDE